MSSIQQTYALLQRMYELMQQIEAQGQRTERQVSKNIESYRKLEAVAARYLVIINQLNLPKDVNKAVQVAATLLVLLQQIQMTIGIIQVGMGPIGWASLFASGTFTVMSAASFGYDMMRGT